LHAIERAVTTIASYQRELHRLVDLLDDPTTSVIGPEELENAVWAIAKAGNTAQGYAGATTNRIKSTYRSFFGWLWETGRIRCNPAAVLHLVSSTSRPSLPISLVQTRLLLETIRKSQDPHARRDEALFALYAFTGLRRCEALALRIADFNPDIRCLTVTRSKREGIALVPVPSVISKILNGYIQDLKKKAGPDRGSFLFHGRHPQCHLSARQVQARFEHWKRVAGLNPCLRIHSFRVGYATALYHHTRDILMVARLLGHRSTHTTQSYIGIGGPDVHHVLAEVFG
jgi:site-specific recombinase XerD